MALEPIRESSFCDENQSDSIVSALYAQKQDGSFCDVIMKVCGRDIYAHSNILSAASPYFKEFLALPRQYSPRSPQVIEIQIDGSEPNVSYEEAVTFVIDFIYTGKINVNESNVSQVSEIARIMQISSVVMHCDDFIAGKVGHDVVVQKKPGVETTANIDAESVANSDYINMLMVKKAGELMRSRGQHNKYLSMVSVSTQVMPKLLGLRESEKDMVDKGVCTDPPVKPAEKLEDERIVHVEVMMDKPVGPRGRGRPRKVKIMNQVQDSGVVDGSVNCDEEQLDKGAEEEADTEKNEEMKDEFAVKCEEELPPRRSARRHKLSSGLGNKDFVYEITQKKRQKTGASESISIDSESEEVAAKSPSVCDVSNVIDDILEEDGAENQSTENLDAVKQEGDGPAHALIELAAAAAAESERNEVDAALSALDTTQEGNKEEQETVESDAAPRRRGRPPLNKDDKPKKKKLKVEREYKQGYKYHCDQCSDFLTNSVRAMARHARSHKMEENECYFCDQKFDEQSGLLTHIDIEHKGDSPFSCAECSLRFKSRTQLNLHLPKHSQDKPFICEVCCAGFKWKHALKNHMITHSNKKEHLCDVCGYATAHKAQLKAHRRIHTGHTLRCTHPGCTYQAIKIQNMKYHMMTHTREKQYKCEMCGQAFSLKKNMIRHQLMHTAENKQGCQDCDFHSSRVDKLKEHMLKAHGVGTPPEKRVRVTDLVNQQYLESGFPPPLPLNPSPQPVIQNEPQSLEKYIIQIESDSGQPVQLMPNQTIVITPKSGSDGGDLGEMAIAMPPGSVELAQLAPLATDGQNTVVLTQQAGGLELGAPGDIAQEQFEIAEVMITDDQMASLVQQAATE